MKTRISLISFLLIFAVTGLFAQETTENYFFSVRVNANFDETTVRVKELLKEHGFGVVTELDMDKKIEEKLEGVDLKPYKLLGVCNPRLAYEAMQAEENIGLFLPCKMIIKEIDETTTEVVSIDPSVMMKMLGNPNLIPIGDEVTEVLKKVIEGLGR